MPFGIFANDRYVDHQLLFHALQWPFTLALPLLDAAHASAAVFSAIAVGCWTFALTSWRVPRAAIWAVVLLASSRFFVDRLMMPRTQSLSIALMFGAIALIAPGDTSDGQAGVPLRGPLRAPRSLALLAFLFVWTYHLAVMLLPILAVIALFQPGTARERATPIVTAGIGVALGFVLHPQSPQTLRFFYEHAFQKVVNSSDQAVGAEWMPVDLPTWIVHTAPVLLLLGVLGLRRRAATTPEARAVLLLALGWAVASTFAVKWLEYAVPFAVFGVALAWRDARWSPWPTLVLTPLLFFNGAQVVGHIRDTLPRADRLAGIAAHLPASDCHVFQADWTDFSELFYHAPQCTLTVGLDPNFLFATEPKRAELVEAALAGRVARLGDMAKHAFDADWVVVTTPPEAAAAAADPHLVKVYEDAAGSLWRVVLDDSIEPSR
ncbi:MAG: hypothetical protein EXR69_14165 [Myxococcales bacterium]|nr:hypothetical protein [Myxococcales bacterium]